MPLLSEIKGWHYYISWDNPVPADSRSMVAALDKLGRLTKLHTKTSVVLSPRIGVGWWDVRSAVRKNLNPIKGNAFYVNLRSGKAFQIGKNTNWLWKRAP